MSYQNIISRIPNSLSGIIEFSIFPKADKFDYSQPMGITEQEKVQFCNFIKSQIKNFSDCDTATWKKILTFAELWIQKGTIFNEMIGNVWFEYDLPFDSKDTPLIPSLFFSLKSGISSKSQGKISNEIISLFFGTIRATQYIQDIMLSCETNSISASVLQLGIMFPRNTDSIRVIIGKLPVNKISSLYEKLNLSSKGMIPNSFVRDFDNYEVNLALNIHQEVESSIGLELIMLNHQKSDEIVKILTVYLIKNNYCDKTFLENIFSWNKMILPSRTDQFWPDSIIFNSLFCKEFTFPRLELKVNHFKFTFIQGALSTIKCYLWYSFAAGRH